MNIKCINLYKVLRAVSGIKHIISVSALIVMAVAVIIFIMIIL